MANDALRDWAIKAWEAEVLKNLPAAKARRAGQAGQRESSKALARARRSLAAQQASTKRKLNTRLEQIEREFQGRREAQDREFEERRWRLLMGRR